VELKFIREEKAEFHLVESIGISCWDWF